MGLRATQCILNRINRIIMDKLAPRPQMFARMDNLKPICQVNCFEIGGIKKKVKLSLFCGIV